MGLDCSHDAFHGAYSAFNRLRRIVAYAAGGSFPPHWEYEPNGEVKEHAGMTVVKNNLDPSSFYLPEGYTHKSHPGLYKFLAHSDCDGKISPTMCTKVANDLESLLPKVEALHWKAGGHLAITGGYVEVLQRFILGCRKAAAQKQSLLFE